MKKPTRKPKPHMVKKFEDDFSDKWKKFSEPIVKDIKKEIKYGRSAKIAVSNVFKKHNVRGNLQQMIMDGVMGALRRGLVKK